MPRDLPTGAKATGAVSFAVVGWLVANAYLPNMPDAATAGNFRELVALLGAAVGWQVMGKSVGKTYYDAVGSGWKTVFVLICYALLLFGIYEMLEQSVKMVYEGPLDAIIDVFNRMLKRSGPLLTFGVVMVAVLAGAVAGVLTEAAHRRWP